MTATGYSEAHTAAEVFGRLAKALNLRSLTYPSVPCEEFYAFALEIFTPEQADIASMIPVGGATAEQMAIISGLGSTQAMQRQLEEMVRAGTVRAVERDARQCYDLLPLVPGIIELQFMHGRVDERTRRLAQLMKSYGKAISRIGTAGLSDVLGVDKSRTRMVSVEQEIHDRPAVLPYSEVMQLIDSADYIAAGTCVCRHQGDLLDKPCDKPKADKCMIFGPSARFAADHGLVRLISPDEARQSVDEAEATGLVHVYANSGDRFIDLLCACCGCHCFILRGAVRSPVPSQAVVADWIVAVDDEACSGCGACVDRCWMQALRMESEVVVRDALRCIGCGLCTYVCPSDAMKLIRRPSASMMA